MENGYWSLDDLCWRNGIARYRVLDTQDGVWSKQDCQNLLDLADCIRLDK